MARRRCRDCLQRSPPRPSLGEGRGSLQNRVACVTRSKLEGKLGGALGFVGRPSRNHPDHRLAPSEGDAKPSPQRPAAQGERREAVLGERGGGGQHPHAVPPGTSEGGSLTCGVCGTPRRRTTSSQTFSAKPSFFPPEPNLGRPRFRDPQASGTTEDRKWMEGKPGEVTHTPA